MGYQGKLELQYKARELRAQGLSVGSIKRLLRVSKSSVSLWVRNIHLTKKQIDRLYLNQKTGGLKGSYIASLRKKASRVKLTKQIQDSAKKEIGSLSNRDKFITGIVLYFAEGNKADKSIVFTNSDPSAIYFMVSWLRVFCNVPISKFRINLYIHDNLDQKKAMFFWSKLTDISLNQFKKNYVVKNNAQRFRKTKHENGVCRVTVSSVNLHRKIMGWISGVFSL